MIACSPLRDRHVDEINKIRNEFSDPNIYPNLAHAYGRMESKWVNEQLSVLYSDQNLNPLNDDFPPLTKSGKLDLTAYKNLRSALKQWDKSLDRSMNSFEYAFRTPSAIYKKNPTTIAFSKKVSSILNSERRNRSVYVDNLRDIAEQFKGIFSAVNYDGSFNKTQKTINKLYDRIASSTASKNIDDATEAVRELGRVMNSDETRAVLDTYVYMMENLTQSDLNSLMRGDFIDAPFDKDVMKRLTGVVRESKTFLDRAGDVNIMGLRKMKDVIRGYFHNSNNENVDGLLNNVDNAIKRIEEGKLSGKYFPHYAVESMLSIEKMLGDVDPIKLQGDTSYQSKVMRDIESSIRSLPVNILAAAPEKGKLFSKDPIRVLESYAHNAVIFNKKQHLMDAYLSAVTDLKPSTADFDGLDRMTDYLAHKYIAVTDGHKDASATVKSLFGTMSKLQAVSKMGLSLSGALRNSTQALYYINYTGYRSYKKGRDLLSSNKTYSISTPDGMRDISLSEIIRSTSSENGYFFDASSMETISKGGLVDLDGVNKNSIKYGVDDNGDPYVEYQQHGVLKRMEKGLGKLAGKSLYFHQLTENIVRGDVYRNAFAQYYDKVFTNNAYKANLTKQYMDADPRLSQEAAMARVDRKLQKDAHNMALNWVRMTQFEYDAADRSIAFGGGTGNMSAIGNTLFQFFPYAAHMFELNYNVYRNGLKAAYQGDFNSFRFGAMARMFGFQTFGVGLVSILLNNQFGYLIENDTYERLSNLYELMTADDIEEIDFGNGLIQQFTGPAVSDMLFWMEAAGFTDFGDDDISKLIFGYHDLKGITDSERERKQINRVSVSLNKILRSKDNFINGDFLGMLRTNFLLYPDAETKRGREKMLELMGVETGKKKERKTREAAMDSMSTLSDPDRDRILKIIRDLQSNRRSEDDGIPSGLQNLTPR